MSIVSKIQKSTVKKTTTQNNYCKFCGYVKQGLISQVDSSRFCSCSSSHITGQVQEDGLAHAASRHTCEGWPGTRALLPRVQPPPCTVAPSLAGPCPAASGACTGQAARGWAASPSSWGR